MFSLRNRFTHHKPVVLSVADVSIALTPSGASAFEAWSGTRVERAELSLILALLREGDVFVDAGSNAGIFALAAAIRRPTATVFAFEPSPETFRLLQRNIDLNGCSNIIAVEVALGTHEGEASLKLNAPGRDGLNTLGGATHPDSRVVGEARVLVTTLDAYAHDHGVTRVDLMKVDVEGGELNLFNGSSDLLRREDAPAILYEGYSWCTAGFAYHPVEIMWLLSSFGYELFRLDEKGRIEGFDAGSGFDSMYLAIKPARLPLLRRIS